MDSARVWAIRRPSPKRPLSANASVPVPAAGSLPPSAIAEKFRPEIAPINSGKFQMTLKRFSSALAMLTLIGLPVLASGHGYRLGDIRIVHPWALSTADVYKRQAR